MPEQPDGAALADARLASLETLCRISGGWSGGTPGARAFATDLPVADMNGVWVMHESASREAIVDGLARVAGRGVPYGIQARPAHHDTAAAAAAAAGLTPADAGDPVMALTDPPPEPVPAGLAISAVDESNLGRFRAVLEDVFGMPAQLSAFFARVLDADPDARMYLGEVDGEAVATAATSVDAGPAGVFGVATSAAHRGHGYGGALTAHAVRAALADGAPFAWLRSTEQGLGVYERIGFRLVERWSCWRSE